MKKKDSVFILKVIFLSAILGIVVCCVVYQFMGATVNSNGMLTEPFFLIPFTYAFALIAIVSCIMMMVKDKKSHKKVEIINNDK